MHIYGIWAHPGAAVEPTNLVTRMKTFRTFRLFFLLAFTHLHAQQRTVGVLQNDPGACPGYTLFAPYRSTFVYLIDNEGRQVHSWNTIGDPGLAVYLLENGDLLHTRSVSGVGGDVAVVRIYDWEGKLKWDFPYTDTTHTPHHDVKMLPNGNVLITAWDIKSRAEAVAAGRDPAKLLQNALWPDHLVEVKPVGPDSGEIVWEWHAWDHLVQDRDSTKPHFGVVADHPELIDLNYVVGAAMADWMHSNSIAYNAEFDQILISVHNFNEIWVIDHSTTKEEAAGHTGGRYGSGGDILYRWGNPAAFDRGKPADTYFYGQHDAQWIGKGLPGAGNILVFNNGWLRPQGRYSSIEELTPPSDSLGRYPAIPGGSWGPTDVSWRYTATPPASFYSATISGVQRLPNGNTLVCNGANGIFFEIDDEDRLVWQYVNPVTEQGILAQGDTVPSGLSGRTNSVFKIRRYPPDYPAFTGKDIKPGDYVEKYPVAVARDIPAAGHLPRLEQNYPNPFRDRTRIRFSIPASPSPHAGRYALEILDMLGRRIYSREGTADDAREVTFDARSSPRPLAAGTYFCRMITSSGISAIRMLYMP